MHDIMEEAKKRIKECLDNKQTIFDLSYLGLTELLDLPDSLTRLDCNNNQLTELPDLPDSLTHLDCENNQLTELPDLPDSLTRLYCYGNQLTELPIKLKSLNVDVNCNNLEELFKMGAIKHIQKVVRSKRFLKKIHRSVVVNRLYEELLYCKNISIIIGQYL